MEKTKSLFGVSFQSLSQKDIFSTVQSALESSGRSLNIATVNAEILLQARQDERFAQTLRSMDMRVVDGSGPQIALCLLGLRTQRLAGADLFEWMLKLANEKKLRVFFVVNKCGLSSLEDIREVCRKRFPDIRVDGMEVEVLHYQDVMNHIPTDWADIVFCNFGAPYQEYFIQLLPSDMAKVAIGVGGSFDFFTGKVRRAPFFWRKLGIEWLWRVMQQPKRMQRIFRAVFIFPLVFVWDRWCRNKDR